MVCDPFPMGRGDLMVAQWTFLEPLLPVGKKPGRPPKWTKRQLIDGIRWRTRAGVPWRDVPARYGGWQAVHGLVPWQRDGTWKRILADVQADADAKGLIDWDVPVDSSLARAHQHAAGARKRVAFRRGPGWCRNRAGPSRARTLALFGVKPTRTRLPRHPRPDGRRWMNEHGRSPAETTPTGPTPLPKRAPTCSYLRVRVTTKTTPRSRRPRRPDGHRGRFTLLRRQPARHLHTHPQRRSTTPCTRRCPG
ncbi:transposase [Streptomyces sp. NPDC093097]|uniref:transposase n=1 Tax=Streptomyces sp. NPDC093097 TaxID=3366027 RepID=UPI00382DBA6F